MNDGWISLHRILLEKSLWIAEPFTRGQAWVDLLMLANYKDGFIIVAGERIDIKRGQCGWSLDRLSKRWKWSRGKAERFLVMLEKDGRIERKTNTRTTIISICNYNDFQVGDKTDSKTDSKTDGHQTDTNNKDNNNNNILTPENYFFMGKNFNLTHKDKDKWLSSYKNLDEQSLLGELQKADDYYQGTDTKNIFFKISSWMERANKSSQGKIIIHDGLECYADTMILTSRQYNLIKSGQDLKTEKHRMAQSKILQGAQDGYIRANKLSWF